MNQAISNFSEHDLSSLPSIANGAKVFDVPSVLATETSLEGYGTLVDTFDEEKVEIVTWPQPSWRPIVPGTGNEGGIVQDVFEMKRVGSMQYAINHAVKRRYVTGWYSDPATASETSAPDTLTRLYTHEANYHPDGGQVFFPRGGAPFVALLALPGDDVTPAHFRAFWFDGSKGVQIAPNVWHQPVYPVEGTAVFDDKQGAVHACVSVDFIGEFGGYLAVPLTRPAGQGT